MVRVVFLVVLISLGLATHASAQSADCADFETQEEAQEWFIDHGGPTDDPAGLDPDEDGIACETLPSQAVDDDDDDDADDDDDDAGDDDDADDDGADDDADDDAAPAEPREPREPRAPREPGIARPASFEPPARTLPVSGTQIAMFGGSGAGLFALGLLMTRIGRRRHTESPEGSQSPARWGDGSLIGW